MTAEISLRTYSHSPLTTALMLTTMSSSSAPRGQCLARLESLHGGLVSAVGEADGSLTRTAPPSSNSAQSGTA